MPGNWISKINALTIGSDSFQTGFLEGFDLTSINQLTLSDDVTLCPDLTLNGTLLESVTIEKNLQKTDNLTKLNTEEFVVDSKNKYFASYNGSLYTKRSLKADLLEKSLDR